MTAPAVVSILGIGATLAVAAIAALWKIVALMIQLDRDQTEYRHALRSEMAALLLTTEARLTRRIEILEQTSHGFRERTRLRSPEG